MRFLSLILLPFQLWKIYKYWNIIFYCWNFAEFERVLFRRKFDKYFTAEYRIQIIERILDVTQVVNPISNNAYCRDSYDDKFLNLAIDIGATCIVSGDGDLLVLHPFQGIAILKSADFKEL